MSYTIETGIAIHKQNRKSSPREGGLVDTLGKMKVGESILVKDKKVGTISAAKTKVAKANGVKFLSRSVEGGIRVWRIE